MPIPHVAEAQVNGTSPWTIISPGWSPEPDGGRGTMDIVWTCLVTIFACSWTVTHPDLPGTDNFPFDSKIRSCVVAVLAPEYLAFSAVGDYTDLRDHAKALKQMTNGPWTMSQSFFVYMGGVQLEFKDCTETLGTLPDGTFGETKAVEDLQRAVQLELLSLEAIVSAKDASWLVAQVLGRAVAKLPITTLEVVTTAYVAYALIVYFCYWYKPQDAEVPIIVNCRNLTKEEFHQKIKDVPIQGKASIWREAAVGSIIAGGFGAVHCAAWHFVFATFTESVIWKVASVLTALVPVFFCLRAGLDDYLPRWMTSPCGVDLFWLLTPLYIITRLYLMVEPFIAFRSVPIGIYYTVNWASWIPHI